MATFHSLIAEAAPRVAIIFNGRPPRLLGTLDRLPDAAGARTRVDTLLIAAGLSAAFISVAEYAPTGARFVVAHG